MFIYPKNKTHEKKSNKQQDQTNYPNALDQDKYDIFF